MPARPHRRTAFAGRSSNLFPPAENWWAHPDSNQGPTGYEPAALPLSYGPA